uniref:Uncharacterized protein n=1 Tax=Esox lucius TaxID=8010 RepID=A0AAY5KLI3_ESOLU
MTSLIEKTTLEKKGTAAPTNITIDEITKSLADDIKKSLKLDECLQEILKKYAIVPGKDNLWNLSDIQKTWGKIQRMSDGLQKTRWSLIVLSEIRKRNDTFLKDNHEKAVRKEKENVRALAEMKQKKEEELNKLKGERVDKVAPPSVKITPSSLYPQAEMKKAAKASGIWDPTWSDLPGWDSLDSDDDSNDDKINVRPLKSKLVRPDKGGKKVLMTYHNPAEPKQLDEWSKHLKHPREVGMKTWDAIKRYKTIYNL